MLRRLQILAILRRGWRRALSAAALAGLIVCALLLQRGIDQYRVQRQSFKTYPTNRVNPDRTRTVMYEGPVPWHLLGPATSVAAAVGVLVLVAFGSRVLVRAVWLMLCAGAVGLWARSYDRRDSLLWARYRLSESSLHEANVHISSTGGGISVKFGNAVMRDGEMIQYTLSFPNPRCHWTRDGSPYPPKYPAPINPAWKKGGFIYFRHAAGSPAFSSESRTFIAPHWALSLPLALPPLFRGFGVWRRWRRRRRGLCAACGYDLRQGHDRCPECGRTLRSGAAGRPSAN